MLLKDNMDSKITISAIIQRIKSIAIPMDNENFNIFWVQKFILDPGNRITGKEILKKLNLKLDTSTDKIHNALLNYEKQ